MTDHHAPNVFHLIEVRALRRLIEHLDTMSVKPTARPLAYIGQRAVLLKCISIHRKKNNQSMRNYTLIFDPLLTMGTVTRPCPSAHSKATKFTELLLKLPRMKY